LGYFFVRYVLLDESSRERLHETKAAGLEEDGRVRHTRSTE